MEHERLEMEIETLKSEKCKESLFENAYKMIENDCPSRFKKEYIHRVSEYMNISSLISTRNLVK